MYLPESKNVLLKLIRCRDDSSSIKSTETTYEIGINSDTITTHHQLYNLFNSALKSGQNIGNPGSCLPECTYNSFCLMTQLNTQSYGSYSQKMQTLTHQIL